MDLPVSTIPYEREAVQLSNLFISLSVFAVGRAVLLRRRKGSNSDDANIRPEVRPSIWEFLLAVGHAIP